MRVPLHTHACSSHLWISTYTNCHVKAEVDPCLWQVENWRVGETQTAAVCEGLSGCSQSTEPLTPNLSEDNWKQNKLNRNWLRVPMEANKLSPKRLFSSNWWSFPRGQRGRKTITLRSDTWRWTSLSPFSCLCFPNLDKGFTSNNHGGMLDFRKRLCVCACLSVGVHTWVCICERGYLRRQSPGNWCYEQLWAAYWVLSLLSSPKVLDFRVDQSPYPTLSRTNIHRRRLGRTSNVCNVPLKIAAAMDLPIVS